MNAAVHADWLIPDWPAPAGVKAVFTTRAGGVSQAPYDAFNLGLHVGDEAQHVAQNRQALCRSIGHAPVFMNQVHGTAVLKLTQDVPHDTPLGDAAWTQSSGVVCTVMVADCLPVLLCSTDGNWVAAAHAGWRGLAGAGGTGILEAVVSAFKGLQAVDSAAAATELIAWLGPCIGTQAFEVGPEVRAAFVAGASERSALEACFLPQQNSKYLANLQQLARLRLSALGVDGIYRFTSN